VCVSMAGQLDSLETSSEAKRNNLLNQLNDIRRNVKQVRACHAKHPTQQQSSTCPCFDDDPNDQMGLKAIKAAAAASLGDDPPFQDLIGCLALQRCVAAGAVVVAQHEYFVCWAVCLSQACEGQRACAGWLDREEDDYQVARLERSAIGLAELYRQMHGIVRGG
jgi:hypothetical protein